MLYIEATLLPDGRGLRLTGQLGDVMQESATAAQSYVWSQAEHLGIDPELFRKSGVHIHVPAGAVPKDGPSAGVAMVTALASLVHAAAGPQRHGHDRRNHAHRPGAADRRRQGKGPGRSPRRHPPRDPSCRQ